MTDRELLRKAAKAQGWRWSMADLCWYDDQAGTWKMEKDWNPLTDDGDALRLAVKLRIEPRQTDGMASALYSADTPNGFAVRNETYSMYNDDPYAATRRAIVRAAAAIGETP